MLVAGNWKMHTVLDTATELASEIVRQVGNVQEIQVAVCPPFVSLEAVSAVLKGSRVHLGAQNMFYEDEGAYTGEISAPMLLSVGCTYVIVGHSERRQYFCETDESVNRKVARALRHRLIPIVCVGETLEQRERGEALPVVQRQVYHAFQGVEPEAPDRLVVAYEPVWAIGTGHTATPEQAQEMHAAIRSWLSELWGESMAREVPILYGGSVKPGNAADLFVQPDIDGGLIGGASLKAESFAAIVEAARAQVVKKRV